MDMQESQGVQGMQFPRILTSPTIATGPASHWTMLYSYHSQHSTVRPVPYPRSLNPPRAQPPGTLPPPPLRGLTPLAPPFNITHSITHQPPTAPNRNGHKLMILGVSCFLDMSHHQSRSNSQSTHGGFPETAAHEHTHVLFNRSPRGRPQDHSGNHPQQTGYTVP